MNRITITNLSTVQPLTREHLTATRAGRGLISGPTLEERLRKKYNQCLADLRFRKGRARQFGQRLCASLFLGPAQGNVFNL